MITREAHTGVCRRPSRVRWAVAVAAVTVPLTIAAAHTHAQPNPSPPGKNVAAALTATFGDLVTTHGRKGIRKTKVRRILRDIAKSRRQRLADLIEDDPGTVVRLAISGDVRARLPRTVRRYVEKEVELDGIVEVLVEDDDAGGRLRYNLKTDRGKRFSLHFAEAPPRLMTGSRIRARGVRLPHSRKLALTSGSMAMQTSPATVAPASSGAQNTLVILVNFQDDPSNEPYPLTHAQDVFFNTTSSFYLEASFDQTWLTGDVFGWYTIPVNNTTCDHSQIRTAAQAAAVNAGVDLSAYSRYVYAFPRNACNWWGLGTVGGNPSHAWINGNLQLMVAGHELGHNFGLYHSNALDCGSVPVGNGCTTISYGDRFDIMGQWNAAHFNAFQKSRLGWVDVVTADTEGTYWASPYETGGVNPTALAVLKSTDPASGKNTWYYLEHRQAIGFDNFLSGNDNVLNGVVVHTGSEATANSSYALDMTPATSSWTDPALVVGESFHDADAGVTITVLAVAADGIGVEVSFGGGTETCVTAAPSLTVAPSGTQWVEAGTTVAYNVTVTNNDSTACGASTLDVDATVPADWTGTIAAPALGIAPGASATTTVEVTSPVSATDGAYDIVFDAVSQADPTLATSATASYGITSGLDVTTWTEHPSYKTGDMVFIWALVETSGVGLANTSVAITISKPDGAVVTQSVTTDADGYAQSNLRLKRRDPAGTYDVTAAAGAVPGPVGSGATTFEVTSGGGGGGGNGGGKKK